LEVLILLLSAHPVTRPSRPPQEGRGKKRTLLKRPLCYLPLPASPNGEEEESSTAKVPHLVDLGSDLGGQE